MHNINEQINGMVREAKDITDKSMHIRDVNSREIFKNNLLASQFLRDYSGNSLFSDLHPEDLEDQSEKFRIMLGIEVEGDTIKKVHLRTKDQSRDIYVIALVEHKSRVDYDVAMQLLLYMSVIWRDYAKKENDKKKDASKAKQFRYPLIFPIVYYEGSSQWTAGIHLSDRIADAELAMDCIPDFTYRVVHLRDFENSDFRLHNNEMSLLMMINRIQGPEDFEEFRKTAQDYMDSIYKNTSPGIQDLIMRVMWGLLMKMKVPEDEAADMLKNIKEGDNMGILFENLKGIDVQATREELRKAKEEAALKEAELEKKIANLEIERINLQNEKATLQSEKATLQSEKATLQSEKATLQSERTKIKNRMYDVEINFINQYKSDGKSKEDTLEALIKIFLLDENDAMELLKMYGNF